MFPLGHVGLAMGALVAITILARRPQWLSQIDMRLVVILSMAPDIIDKPLGNFILGENLNNGRIFAHTLVFLILASVVLIIIFKKMFWAYALPILAHQLLDMMWEIPRTWFWPLFGFGFRSWDYNVWEHWFEQLFGNYYVISGEAFGLLILITIFVFFKVYQKENFLRGLKRGRLL